MHGGPARSNPSSLPVPLPPLLQVDATGRTYKGHTLETETYLGGHVECLESGAWGDAALELLRSRVRVAARCC